MDLERNFWRYVEKRGTCLIWIGGIDGKGYGEFYDGRKSVRAHRWAYEHWIGPIPEGLVLDHLCRDRRCVNAGQLGDPSHLDAVTQRENLLRGIGPTARKASQTHCVKGHPFSGNNLIIRSRKAGGRQCRACKLDDMKQSYRRRKERLRIHLMTPQEVREMCSRRAAKAPRNDQGQFIG